MSKSDKLITVLTYQKVMAFKDQLDEEVFEHLVWMLLEVGGTHTHINDIRKVNRWLGFVHGTLVASTDCTLEELKDMIREED